MKRVSIRNRAIGFAAVAMLSGLSSIASGDPQAAAAPDCKSAPCNSAPPPPDQSYTPSKKELRHLVATASSVDDYLTIVRYYQNEAKRLDAEATGYEDAAQRFRQNPGPKNLRSPTSAGQYEYRAKQLRAEAKSDLALAAHNEELARKAAKPADGKFSQGDPTGQVSGFGDGTR